MGKEAQASGFSAYIEDAIVGGGFTSSTQFAREAGLDPSVVRRWINGQQRPTLRLLERVAPVLKVPVDQLIRAAYPDRVDGDAAVPPPLHPLAREVDLLLGPNSRLSVNTRNALETVLQSLLDQYGRPARRKLA